MKTAVAIVDPDLHAFGREALLDDQVAVVIIVDIPCCNRDSAGRGVHRESQAWAATEMNFNPITTGRPKQLRPQKDCGICFLIAIEVGDRKPSAQRV